MARRAHFTPRQFYTLLKCLRDIHREVALSAPARRKEEEGGEDDLNLDHVRPDGIVLDNINTDNDDADADGGGINTVAEEEDDEEEGGAAAAAAAAVVAVPKRLRKVG